MSDLPESDPTKPPFTPEVLDRTVIAIPLLSALRNEEHAQALKAETGRDLVDCRRAIARADGDKARAKAMLEKGTVTTVDQEKAKAGEADDPRLFDVIIDLNLEHRAGAVEGRKKAVKLIETAIKGKKNQFINHTKSDLSSQYLFARLEGSVIRRIVEADNKAGRGSSSIRHRSIYRIWPDFPVKALITKSVSTVKADAARASFAALGDGIVWAVMDSGIWGKHPHFTEHKNLDLSDPLKHSDFTGSEDAALTDEFGHGTHVAGIIAGGLKGTAKRPITAVARQRDENGDVSYNIQKIDEISGMAPKCKLLSLKVLNDRGEGLASNLIAAIAYIQKINGNGRRIRIQGVNMSVGYDFEPEWFACGQSPLCVEVDQLVRSGVVVVVAAGNTGYGWQQSAFRGTIAAGMDLTINDPGNADKAITVGSTHRDKPHVYGVSYFSSKGPTGDGRLKPDLVAPGEKILSCAAGQRMEKVNEKIGSPCTYLEDSGTSMAAPHVSGVIAAFLSIRDEFIGRAEEVKEIFLSTATDLKRERTFQGHGLVDLMRAIQSV
jgi:serine protease AprX